MTDEKHNGWTDRPTWAVNLWITSYPWSDVLLGEIVAMPWNPVLPSAIRALAKQAGVLADISEEELQSANVKEIYDVHRKDRIRPCPGCGREEGPCPDNSCVRNDDE